MPARLWTAAGYAALAVGALGALLPLLPTTPFVILAAFAFGKGSPRLRARLDGHPVFGPAIRDWHAHGAIAPRYKAISCAAMALSLVGSAAAGLPPVLLAVQAVLLGAGAAFVLTRPSGPAPRCPSELKRKESSWR